MMVILPANALTEPPETGASIGCMPLAARRSHSSSEAEGGIVTQSTNTVPARAVANAPFGPNSTCSV